MEQKLVLLEEEIEKNKKYTRKLEQINDDLERSQRVISESVQNFETMLDDAYEKNALLEIEIDEKEMLQIKLQRLMDEIRGLSQTLLFIYPNFFFFFILLFLLLDLKQILPRHISEETQNSEIVSPIANPNENEILNRYIEYQSEEEPINNVTNPFKRKINLAFKYARRAFHGNSSNRSKIVNHNVTYH